MEVLPVSVNSGTWCDEQWVLYPNNESLNITPEANDVLLYVG